LHSSFSATKRLLAGDLSYVNFMLM